MSDLFNMSVFVPGVPEEERSGVRRRVTTVERSGVEGRPIVLRVGVMGGTLSVRQESYPGSLSRTEVVSQCDICGLRRLF